MNGHERRKEQKKEIIKNTAMELFDKYGVKRVSMDEIAKEAQVSKVTIYKYFQSKEDLFKDLIISEYENSVTEAETIINTEKDFLEKLYQIISLKKSSRSLIGGEYAKTIINSDNDIGDLINSNFNKRFKDLFNALFDQGKREHYIDQQIPNEMISLYIEIFKSGLAANAEKLKGIIHNKEQYEQLIDLYFFGLIKKRK